MTAAAPTQPPGDPDTRLPWWDLRAYHYELPSELIAQHPAEQRDQSRLLVYDRQQGSIEHRIFRDLASYIVPGDALVLNDCRVIPARLYARRRDTGTPIELLLIRSRSRLEWEALVKPGRSCKPGVIVTIGAVSAEIYDCCDDGRRLVRFSCSPTELERLFATEGVVPLPPYITRPHAPSSATDRERYQTVYARSGQAVAAPTAGLHFTAELLTELEERGCRIVPVTLDVGPGTFQPVKTGDIREHRMHAEQFVFSAGAAEMLNTTRAGGGRIIAVGTTSLRVLESCLNERGKFEARAGSTDIFIHPPGCVRSIDGLITNFHLPQSTLLMLVAAWVGGDAWRGIYAEAVARRYRFYSYGDSMLLL